MLKEDLNDNNDRAGESNMANIIIISASTGGMPAAYGFRIIQDK